MSILICTKVNFCGFYNPEFIIYSSLGSFYIPWLIMVVLYSSIFKVTTAHPTPRIALLVGPLVRFFTLSM